MPAFLSLAFSLLVATVLIMPESVDLLARLGTKESKQFSHYEGLFNEARFTSTDGQTLKLAEIAAPVVIVNFWASWCKPCLEEFPSLVELREQFGENELAIIGINSDEEDQVMKLEKTTQEFGLNFFSVADQDGELLNQFMVNTLPVTIVYVRGKVHLLSKGKKDFMAEEFLEVVRSSQKAVASQF